MARLRAASFLFFFDFATWRRMLRLAWRMRKWTEAQMQRSLRVLAEQSFHTDRYPLEVLARHPEVPHAIVDYAELAAELHADGIAVNTLAPVAAVLTPGVGALGATPWLEPSMIEPVEAIAEAALALASCNAALSGRVTYSLPLLRELKREIRTLDGEAVFEVGR